MLVFLINSLSNLQLFEIPRHVLYYLDVHLNTNN